LLHQCFYSFQPHRQSQVFFATTHNSWLQSRTPNSCSHTLVQFFCPFAVTEINQQFLQSHTLIFAITYYPGLQSYSK
jgi:hypothetical protein